MEANSKEIIYRWLKQEKVFLYKIGYVFLANEEEMEETVIRTINTMQESFVRIDEQFKKRFMATFIKQCLLKDIKQIDLRDNNDISQKLFKLEAPFRQCIYFKYVLLMSDLETAQLLRIRDDVVATYVINGFEQLIIDNGDSSKIALHHLVNYHEGKLSFDQYKVVNEKLVEDDNYRILLEKIICTINDLEQLGRDLKPSLYFLDPNKPLTEAQIKKKKRKQRIFTSVVSFLFFMAILISSIGITELEVKWKAWTAETVGFGENVYVTAVDQDIEITVTHVAADDLQTILFYEIRHLEDQYHYNVDFHYDMFEVLERYDRDKWDTDHFNFYSTPRTFSRLVDEDRVSEGRLFLPPLKNEEDTITVRFNTIELINKEIEFWQRQNPGNITQIQGEWELTVPVKKYEPIIIDIDQTITVDVYEFNLQTLEVRPTGTFLDYQIEPIFDGERYFYQNLYFSNIQADGKLYEQDFYLENWRNNRNRHDQWVYTHSFEAIYYDLPDEIEVGFDRLVSHQDYQFEIAIDYENLPMEFEFLDTTITISEVKLGNPFVIVLQEEVDENRSYDSFNFDFYYDFHESNNEVVNYGWGISSEGVYMDREGNKYNDFEEVMKLDNPYNFRYLTTQQKIEIYFHDDDVDESLFPEKIMIRGFSKSHMIDERINISLNSK